MDQVKAILKQLQKYHFWLLCVLAMVAALVGWFMARKSLMADYEKNKGTITGKFSSLQGILTTERHPNSTWTQEMSKLTDKEKQLVRTAWEDVYNEQQKHLEWPPELGDRFLKFISGNPPNATIPQDLCGMYQDRIIKSEFPRLLAIVDAQAHNAVKSVSKSSPPANRAKGGPAVEEEPEREYKVIWEATSQQELEKSLDFSSTPSSAEVRQAQEDIWVYKALLTIIKAMNDDSYIARVPRISEISIGQRAVKPFQDGMAPNRIERQKSGAGDPAAAPPAAPPAGEGEAVEKPIDEGRYVDPEGKPLPSGEAASKQFKRMPIYMELSIDQRQINKFLVHCANSPLPVEVRQLRIGAAKQSGSAAKGGGQSTDQTARSEAESFEVPIKVAGIIYIYNPPDMTKLGGSAPNPSASAGP